MKNTDVIKLAYRKGYRVREDGTLENAHGRVRKCCIKKKDSKNPYKAFSMAIPGSYVHHVLLHRFLAYQRWGDAVFAPGILVRHLNGNSLDNRFDNITLGTPVDNAMDRDPEVRKAHAIKASNAARGLPNKGNNKYTDELWDRIHKDRAGGMGYKRLAKKYNMPKSTVAHHLRKRMVNEDKVRRIQTLDNRRLRYTGGAGAPCAPPQEEREVQPGTDRGAG